MGCSAKSKVDSEDGRHDHLSSPAAVGGDGKGSHRRVSVGDESYIHDAAARPMRAKDLSMLDQGIDQDHHPTGQQCAREEGSSEVQQVLSCKSACSAGATLTEVSGPDTDSGESMPGIPFKKSNPDTSRHAEGSDARSVWIREGGHENSSRGWSGIDTWRMASPSAASRTHLLDNFLESRYVKAVRVPGGVMNDLLEHCIEIESISVCRISSIVSKHRFRLMLITIAIAKVMQSVPSIQMLDKNFSVHAQAFRYVPLSGKVEGDTDISFLLNGCRLDVAMVTSQEEQGKVVFTFDKPVSMNGWSLKGSAERYLLEARAGGDGTEGKWKLIGGGEVAAMFGQNIIMGGRGTAKSNSQDLRRQWSWALIMIWAPMLESCVLLLVICFGHLRSMTKTCAALMASAYMVVGIFALVGGAGNLGQIITALPDSGGLSSDDLLLTVFMLSTAMARLVVVMVHRVRTRCVVCALMLATVFVLVCDCVAQAILSGDAHVQGHSAWYYVEVVAVTCMWVVFKSWELVSWLLAKALVEKDRAYYETIWNQLLGEQRGDIKCLVQLVSEVQDEITGVAVHYNRQHAAVRTNHMPGSRMLRYYENQLRNESNRSMSYSGEWSRTLQHATVCGDHLSEEPVAAAQAETEEGQKDLDFRKPVRSIDQLYAQANGLTPLMRSKVLKWATAHGGALMQENWRKELRSMGRDERSIAWTPLKSVKRAVTKAYQAYNGDVSRLVDICRESIVFESVADLAATLVMIVEDPGTVVERIKNMYDPGNDCERTYGFRSVVVNLRIVGRLSVELGLETHVCEVQLLLKPFAIALRNAPARHARYLQFRDTFVALYSAKSDRRLSVTTKLQKGWESACDGTLELMEKLVVKLHGANAPDEGIFTGIAASDTMSHRDVGETPWVHPSKIHWTSNIGFSWKNVFGRDHSISMSSMSGMEGQRSSQRIRTLHKHGRTSISPERGRQTASKKGRSNRIPRRFSSPHGHCCSSPVSKEIRRWSAEDCEYGTDHWMDWADSRMQYDGGHELDSSGHSGGLVLSPLAKDLMVDGRDTRELIEAHNLTHSSFISRLRRSSLLEEERDSRSKLSSRLSQWLSQEADSQQTRGVSSDRHEGDTKSTHRHEGDTKSTHRHEGDTKSSHCHEGDTKSSHCHEGDTKSSRCSIEQGVLTNSPMVSMLRGVGPVLSLTGPMRGPFPLVKRGASPASLSGNHTCIATSRSPRASNSLDMDVIRMLSSPPAELSHPGPTANCLGNVCAGDAFPSVPLLGAEGSNASLSQPDAVQSGFGHDHGPAEDGGFGVAMLGNEFRMLFFHQFVGSTTQVGGFIDHTMKSMDQAMAKASSVSAVFLYRPISASMTQSWFSMILGFFFCYSLLFTTYSFFHLQELQSITVAAVRFTALESRAGLSPPPIPGIAAIYLSANACNDHKSSLSHHELDGKSSNTASTGYGIGLKAHEMPMNSADPAKQSAYRDDDLVLKVGGVQGNVFEVYLESELKMKHWYIQTNDCCPDADPARFILQIKKSNTSAWDVVGGSTLAYINGWKPFYFSGAMPLSSPWERSKLWHPEVVNEAIVLLECLIYVPVEIGFLVAMGMLCFRDYQGAKRAIAVVGLGGMGVVMCVVAGRMFSIEGHTTEAALMLTSSIEVLGMAMVFMRFEQYFLCTVFVYGVVLTPVRVLVRCVLYHKGASVQTWVWWEHGGLIVIMSTASFIAVVTITRLYLLYWARRLIAKDMDRYDLEWTSMIKAGHETHIDHSLQLLHAACERGQEQGRRQAVIRQCYLVDDDKVEIPKSATMTLMAQDFTRMLNIARQQPVTSLDQLYAQAMGVNIVLRGYVQQCAVKCNGYFALREYTHQQDNSADFDAAFVRWNAIRDRPDSQDVVKWGGIKRPRRAIEKLLRVYEGDVSRLVDICRQVIVFDTLDDLIAAVNFVMDDPGVVVERIKNRMSKKYDARLSAGYRDVLINLRMVDQICTRLGIDSHICELQFTHKSFAMLRNDMGHQRYVTWRNVMGI